jgi:hypothetical protein
MACWSLQSRNAKALRCCQTNGLADIAYSFMMTAITPVNIAYAYELTNFSSAGGAADASGLPQFVRKPTRKWTPAQPKRSLRKHAQSTGTVRGR